MDPDHHPTPTATTASQVADLEALGELVAIDSSPDRTLCEVPPRQRTVEPVASFDHTKLLALREAAALSQDRLVETINKQAGRDAPAVSRPQLIGYEKGRVKPGIDVLGALAKALGVDPIELMSVDETTATLADLRARAGLNKATVASRLEMATTTFDAIERGRRTLQPDVAGQLARMLKTKRDAVIAAHQRGLDQRSDSHTPDTRQV